MAFFEALRKSVGRYASGVHQLNPPTDERLLFSTEERLQQSLPASHRDFLRSFNGVALFHESLRLFAAAEIVRVETQPRYLRVGETPDGALYLGNDEKGRLYLVDEDAPDPILVGSDTESWLDATLGREGLLFDREGEFRDVFTDQGLSLAVRRKRFQLGQRYDAQAALYLLEQAELSCEDGDLPAAISLLQKAVAQDPNAGPAWELLATLCLDCEQIEAGQQAALQAAAATWHPPLRAARQALALRIRTRSSLRVVAD